MVQRWTPEEQDDDPEGFARHLNELEDRTREDSWKESGMPASEASGLSGCGMVFIGGGLLLLLGLGIDYGCAHFKKDEPIQQPQEIRQVYSPEWIRDRYK